MDWVHQQEIAVAREQERVFNAKAELSAAQEQLEKTRSARTQLIEAARHGDENALENLTLDEIDTYTMITKKILKEILYRYVPKEMMDRPKKGFSVPLSQWLRGEELHDWAGDILLSSRDKMGMYVNLKTVDAMWKRFIDTGEGERDIWSVLMLGQWFLNR